MNSCPQNSHSLSPYFPARRAAVSLGPAKPGRARPTVCRAISFSVPLALTDHRLLRRQSAGATATISDLGPQTSDLGPPTSAFSASPRWTNFLFSVPGALTFDRSRSAGISVGRGRAEQSGLCRSRRSNRVGRLFSRRRKRRRRAARQDSSLEQLVAGRYRLGTVSHFAKCDTVVRGTPARRPLRKKCDGDSALAGAAQCVIVFS